MTTATTALAWLGGLTNRTIVLPLVVFFPTSRCNSRCLSCTWWQSAGSDDLTLAESAASAASLARLGTKLVVFSGGEPLLRPDVFAVADEFRRRGMKLHLLTSGLALARHARDVAARFERVIVSLDADTAALYAEIRGVDGFAAVERGVAELARHAPRLPVTARATLHRRNFRRIGELVDTARGWGLQGISFLAADVVSGAFGRQGGFGPRDLLLTADEIQELRARIDALVDGRPELFASGFVAESPAALRRLPQYYAAMRGDAPFPGRACDAPWISAVIEANGDVRPCFFQPPVGNLRDGSLEQIVRRAFRAFRAGLDIGSNETCRRCVCSLKVDWRRVPWQ